MTNNPGCTMVNRMHQSLAYANDVEITENVKKETYIHVPEAAKEIGSSAMIKRNVSRRQRE